MRCVSYMRKDSLWHDEHSSYHEQAREKNKSTPYYDLDGDLIAQQREHIHAYARELGWVVEEEYIDMEGTDAFERLKDDCISRKFDHLIIDSFFRFSGNVGEAKVILQHVFIPVGIQFAVVQDKFCSEAVKEQEIDYFLDCKLSQYLHEGAWIKDHEGTPESRKKPPRKGSNRKRGISIIGTQIHDGETGEVLRFNGQMGNGVFYRESDRNTVRWGVESAVVPRDGILRIVEKVLENEKAAALRAIEELDYDTAERYREMLLSPLKERAAQLVTEIDRLYVMKMERAKDTEKDNTEEDGRLARIEEEFREIRVRANQIRTAYSPQSLWIKLYAGMDIPEKLENWHIRRYITDIRIYGLGAGGGYRVKVIPKQEVYRSLLPVEWLPGLDFYLPGPAEKPNLTEEPNPAEGHAAAESGAPAGWEGGN